MTSMNANGASAARWRNRQRIDGKRRITIWTDGLLTAMIDDLAKDLDVPRAVAVEHIVNDYFGMVEEHD